MGDRILLASFFMIFVIWGAVSIIFPGFVFRGTGINTQKKKPTKAQLRNYKIGGYVMLFIGITLVIFALCGGFKGT